MSRPSHGFRSVLRAFAPLVGAWLASGCVYTNVTEVLDWDVGNTPVASKHGEASAQSFLWLVAFGDAGIQTAARNGGLQVMHHADRQIVSVLFGLYFSTTTIVYGE